MLVTEPREDPLGRVPLLLAPRLIFFQDLVESNIYPLAIYLDDEDTVFNHSFFYDTPNHLTSLLPDDVSRMGTLRLIEVAEFRPGYHIDLVMDDERGRAVAFLALD